MTTAASRKTVNTVTDDELDALYELHETVGALHADDGYGYCTACRLTPAPCATRRAVEGPTAIEGALIDDDTADTLADGAYRERAQILAWLAATLPAGDAVLTPAPDVGIPGWMILFLQARGRQLSWHIAPRDVGLFSALEVVTPEDRRAMWDGHTTPEKYERIADIVRELGSQCGPECSETHTYTGRCGETAANAEAMHAPETGDDHL